MSKYRATVYVSIRTNAPDLTDARMLVETELNTMLAMLEKLGCTIQGIDLKVFEGK